MTEDFEHPDAVLNAVDPSEIVEFDFNAEEYFQVLDCPELEHNEQIEHQDFDAISETTRSCLASGTNMELIGNNIPESDDSGSVVPNRTGIDALTKIQESAAPEEFKYYNSMSSPSLLQPSLTADDSGSVVSVSDREDINTAKELSSCTTPMVVLTELKQTDVSDDFQSKNKTSPAQPSSDAAHIKRRLRNKSSNKKSAQSTSSSIVLLKTGGARRHEKIHTGERPFNCSLCTKTFAYSSNLKDHKRSHTGERPFKCSICAKAFAQRSVVKRHEIIHTGKKPFKCTFCAIAFARRSNLNRHYNTHTGERPFKCTSCTKTFVRMSHLKIHEIVHTEERKPFKCSYCRRGYSRLHYARKHERTHWGETINAHFVENICPTYVM